MASISMRSGPPGSPTHLSASSAPSRRRNGLHDVDLNTFIAEEMALHLDNGNRKRSSAQCNDVITDSPTHKRNRLIWALNKNDCEVRKCHSLILASYSDQEMKATSNSAHHSPAHSLIGHKSPVRSSVGRRCSVQRPKCPSIGFCWQTHNIVHYIVVWVDRLCAFKICVKGWTDTIERRNRKKKHLCVHVRNILSYICSIVCVFQCMGVHVGCVSEGVNGQFCVSVFPCGTCLFLQHLSLPQLSVTTLRLQKQQVLFFNIIDDVIHNFLLPSLNSAPVAGHKCCDGHTSAVMHILFFFNTSVSQHSSSCFDTLSPAPLSPV